MLRRQIVIFAGVFWGILSPPFALAQTDLRFQWKDQDRQVYALEKSVRQTLEVFGTRSETEVREEEHRVRQLHKTDQPGQFRIDQRTEYLTYRLLSGDAVQFVFDSRQPDGEDPLKRMTQLRRALAARSQASWSTTVDTQRLDVIAVEGLDMMLNQLESPLVGQLSEVYAPDYLIAKEQEWFHGMPLEAVEMGQSWTRRVEHRLGEGQRLQLDYRYTYVGRELKESQSLERIDVVVDKASWSVDEAADVALSIKPQALKVVASNGTLLFSSAFGRIESFRVMVQLRGTVQFKLGMTEDAAQLEFELNRELQRLAPDASP